MTGTDMIKAKILEDARKKAAETEEQARREAQVILKDASDEAERKTNDILMKAEADSQEVYRRLLAAAGLEGRKEILRAKQEMVEAAFQGALEKFANLPDTEYRKLIENMVVCAASKGSGEILLSEKDSRRIGKDFLSKVNGRLKAAGKDGKLVLSKDTIRSKGGFILRSGDMEVNGTLEILFTTLRPELENEVVRILFGT